MTEKLVIIGSGPAGLTAAIYAARAGLKTLIIEGPQTGGQLTITSEVDNYPGFPEGIMGPDLMANMRKQAERFGVNFLSGLVENANFKKKPLEITVDNKKIEAEVVIIATGAIARWLGLDSEKKLMGKGVSACATCDGFFFKGKKVVVVGGGDTALEEAMFLTHFASSVKVIHRRDELRASNIMQEKAKKNPKISFIWNSVVEDILDVGKGVVTGVKIKDVKTNKVTIEPCEGVFLAIGFVPNTKPFMGQLDVDSDGYIVTQPGSTLTNVSGVFAAGDCADRIFRQAITAAGSGCMAAIEAERFLSIS
jgi:thioredoxin reductase (NADPH)